MARKVLDTSKNGASARSLLMTLGRRVVGQVEGLTALVDMVEQHQAGHSDPNHPAGSLLILGPTGAGKTHVAEALSRGLFGSEKAMVKIDCAEFQHSHEIAKLIGSPPGYLGHRETPPLLKQARLDQYFTEKQKLGVLLFDEIEKASDALWQLLLGILDKATLTLGDNTTTNFQNQIIVMTSNLGTKEVNHLIDGGIGFNVERPVEEVEARLDETAINAAKRKFTAEFFNRLDKVVVFKTLTKEQIAQVLDMELAEVAVNLILHTNIPFFLHVSPSAKKAILNEGYDAKYGARALRRVIRRNVQVPLARLVSTEQITEKADVYVNYAGGAFEFIQETQ